MNIIDRTTIHSGEGIFEYSLFSKREKHGIYYVISVRLQRGTEATLYTLPDIFTSQSKATTFYHCAKRNLITPIGMPYFLEDCICVS